MISGHLGSAFILSKTLQFITAADKSVLLYILLRHQLLLLVIMR